MKPWQYVAIGGVIVLLCLCVLLVNAVGGILNLGKPAPTFTRLPSLPAAPRITVLVYSPTPAPATFAPIPTRVPPTLTIEPTQVPKPSSTATTTPLPTATRTTTPTQTSIPAPDTLAGSALKPGETWRQLNMAMTLQNPNFAVVGCGAFLEFDLNLENSELSQIVVTWRGEDLVLKDDQEKVYEAFYSPMQRPMDCSKYAPMTGVIVPGLAAKQNIKILAQVRGELNDKASKLYVVVAKAGRIQNARWEIPVQR